MAVTNIETAGPFQRIFHLQNENINIEDRMWEIGLFAFEAHSKWILKITISNLVLKITAKN